MSGTQKRETRNECPSLLCGYHISHILYIAYCYTVYKLLLIHKELFVTHCELLVTHINQFVNFTVELGGNKETVPANMNYTKLTVGQ